MSVYTVRFAAARLDASPDSLLFTTPGDAAYVLRDLIVTNLSPSAARISVVVWVPSTSSQLFLAIAPAMEPESTLHVDLRQRLETDEELHVFHPEAGVTVMATGYKLA